MADFPSKNSEDSGAWPLNERSSAFIDGAAFLNFVRLKSLTTPIDGNAAKAAATLLSARDPAIVSLNELDSIAGDRQSTCQIAIEDWDFLFSAVEQRLRDTVAQLDLAPTVPDAQNSASRIKAVVLDCVNALDQLHMALRQERSTHAAGHAQTV